MRIDETAWIAKARKRKTYRDLARENFYAKAGDVKFRHVQSLKGAPKQQRLHVVKLLNLTRKGSLDANHKQICTLMAAAIYEVGLGHGNMGTVAPIISDLSSYEMVNLRNSFFHSPAFFD